MVMKITMTLDHVWSITDAGWLSVETVPKNQPNKILGEFTFDDDTVLDSLDEDIRIKKDEDPSYDIADWINLKNNLLELSQAIQDKLDEAFG